MRALAVLAALCAATSPVVAAPGWQERVTAISDNPADRAWVARQYSQAGQWCCNGADAHRVEGNYTLHTDGSVTVDTPNGPVNIPPEQVLGFNKSDPNPTGSAIWWYWGDSPTADGTYCFSIGPLT